jgi:cholesterol transport system auxiliary component
MLRTFIVFVFIILLTGCAVKQPYITEYKIEIEKFQKAQASQQCKEKTLKVNQSFSDNTLMSTQMNYIEGKHKQYSFSQARWNIPVNQMVTFHLTDMLDQLDIFKSVQSYKSITKDDYILQSNIIDFKQYFSEDLKSSYVKAVIHISLIDNYTNKIIDSKTFSSVIPSETLDSYGGVKSLNKALVNILKDISFWLKHICNNKEINSINIDKDL